MGEIQPSSAPLTGAPKGDVRASEPGQLGSGPEADRSFEPPAGHRQRGAAPPGAGQDAEGAVRLGVAPQRIFLGYLYRVYYNIHTGVGNCPILGILNITL